MSLRLRLLAFIGVSLTLLWGVVAMWMFMDIRGELRAALDDRLAASARMVAGLVSQLPPSAAPVQGQRLPLLDMVARDGLACEVSLLRGEVVVRTMAQTAGSPGLADTASGYGTYVFGGKPWRTYVLVQDGIRIAMADRLDVRETLLRDIALSAGLPFAVALVFSMVLLWFDIGRGLAPIERIRMALAQRSLDDEKPLPGIEVPAELTPLMATIHHLLERVRGVIARERRFTDDAAHELRTPLTAIKTHLQVARLAVARPQAGEVLAQALSSADQGVLRLQGTLDQLLLLARLHGQPEQVPTDHAEAGAAARQAMDDVRAAHETAGRLVFQQLQPGRVFELTLPGALLVCALRNLLDNALRYSPATTPVILRIEYPGNGRACFSVLDEGPGLTATEREQAPRRFWRRAAGAQQGSGLGLSIVSAIAERHGCELRLLARETRGLEARLLVPMRER
ncbi:MAG TPA: ATP-binding protein [Burkholderiales bacterium]|nr:ATP-binding protein [Burkholderiales bacterium]